MPKELIYEFEQPTLSATLPANAKVDVYVAVKDANTDQMSEWLQVRSNYSVLKISNAQIDTLSADKITSGTLDASKVNVTNLNASNITSGTLTIKGTGGSGPQISVLDSFDREIVKIDSSGVNVKDATNNTIVTLNASGIVVDKGSIVVKDGTGATIIDSTGILKVKDGVITSASLSSSAVTPDKVGFPMLDNELVINSDFCAYDANGNPVASMEGWIVERGQVSVVDVSDSNPPASNFALQNNYDGVNVHIVFNKKLIPVEHNKTYVAECYARKVSGSVGTFRIVVDLFDRSMQRILTAGASYWYYAASQDNPSANWTYYYGLFGSGTTKPFPDNAAYMRIGVVLSNGGDLVTQVQGLTIRQVLDSVYIKDASITTAKIKDAAITDAKISSLSANKITTGTLTVGGSSNVTLRIIKPDGTTMAQFDNTGLKIFGGSLQVYSGSTTSSATVINGNSISADYITTGTLTISSTSSPQIRIVSSDSLGAMILGYYDDGTGNLFKGIRISRTDTVPKSIFLGFDQNDQLVLSAQNSDLNISAQSLVINATGTIKSGTINATNELSVVASNQSKPFKATPDTGVEILLGSGSNNNSAFTLSYQSNTNLNWKIDYQPSRSFTRVFDGVGYTIGNSTGIWFDDNNETTFGIIRDTNRTSTKTRLFYVLNKSLDTSLSSLSQYRTIDGRTIIPRTIPLDAMYSYTKATATGSYTDVTSSSSISVSIVSGDVKYNVNALDPYYTNQTCTYFDGFYEAEVTKVQVYGYSASATNYSQSVASSGSPRTVTLSWTIPTLPSTITTNERRTTYHYSTQSYSCSNITADMIATYGSVVSDVLEQTTRSVSSYDYRSGNVKVSFSINVGTTYAGRQYKVILAASTGTANIDGYATRILYGTVASNGTITFNSTINVTTDLLSNAQFTVKVEVMNISTYIQPVSLPGYVVFATSGTGAAVNTSGNTPSGYLDGTAGNVYPTVLPGYVQNYFNAASGSAVANTGIVYVYELDKVFGSAKNVQVFIRFWDDRYAVYSYNGTSWSKVSSNTTYNTNASTIVTVSNCMKVAIAYSNGGSNPGGIEFALRIY